MRIDSRLRFLLYALTAALFLTGGAWWFLDWIEALARSSAWRQAGVYLLMVHGGAAMLSLVLLGALVGLHVRAGWTAGSNRRTGVVVLAANAVLIVTAFGLYYAGQEGLRRWTGIAHEVVGFALPVLLASHVLLGYRQRVARAAILPAAGPATRLSTASPEAAVSPGEPYTS